MLISKIIIDILVFRN